ncbi:MAG: RMD1 family protein, partial [Proteobacteria bacterium]|nr:RMD1 family protein [Pseudomonadota bacterium]
MQTHTLRSYVFTQSIDMVELSRKFIASQSSIDPKASLCSKISEDGYVFIFNHGSVVFWNVPAEIQTEQLNKLLGLDPVPTLKPTISDSFAVIEEQGPVLVEFNRLVIDHLNPDRMEVIASTLAQSTSMEYYESLVEEAWKQVDKMLADMSRRGTNTWLLNPINRRIAEALTLRSTVVR